MAEKTGKPDYDFGGWATRYNVLCSDGRTIKPNAFEHADSIRVPLVWRHFHNSPKNVLGSVVLEHRAGEGVYAWGRFNDSETGVAAKKLVTAGDIRDLSIYANELVEASKLVHSGRIREVSLVLSGANKGAFIDNITLEHSDEPLLDEAVIYTSEHIVLAHENVVEHAEDGEDEGSSDETIGDVFNTLSEKQKMAVYAILAEAVEGSADLSQSDNEGETFMKDNIFENQSGAPEGPVLSHEETQNIFEAARQIGSLKKAVLQHAGTYGIDNISNLFPDAKAVSDEPFMDTRDMGWVAPWMRGTKHLPWSSIKNIYADLTPDEARAKGYVTGDQKIEEVFAVLKRETTATTVYKKQKLDRDDIIEITDFDVVRWMKKEMRMMLDEEIARASLVGDGRTFGVDADAINPEKIRPIYGDDSLYVHYQTLELAVSDYGDIFDDFMLARAEFKGTGRPNLYIDPDILNQFLLLKDTTNRYIFNNENELKTKLRVNEIVEVEVFAGVQRSNAAPAFTADLFGIFVNPIDYSFGTNRGGEVNLFDDFDLDYNQEKYLIETRLSGALVKPHTAVAIERKTA